MFRVNSEFFTNLFLQFFIAMVFIIVVSIIFAVYKYFNKVVYKTIFGEQIEFLIGFVYGGFFFLFFYLNEQVLDYKELPLEFEPFFFFILLSYHKRQAVAAGLIGMLVGQVIYFHNSYFEMIHFGVSGVLALFFIFGTEKILQKRILWSVVLWFSYLIGCLSLGFVLPEDEFFGVLIIIGFEAAIFCSASVLLYFIMRFYRRGDLLLKNAEYENNFIKSGLAESWFDYFVTKQNLALGYLFYLPMSQRMKNNFEQKKYYCDLVAQFFANENAILFKSADDYFIFRAFDGTNKPLQDYLLNAKFLRLRESFNKKYPKERIKFGVVVYGLDGNDFWELLELAKITVTHCACKENETLHFFDPDTYLTFQKSVRQINVLKEILNLRKYRIVGIQINSQMQYLTSNFFDIKKGIDDKLFYPVLYQHFAYLALDWVDNSRLNFVEYHVKTLANPNFTTNRITALFEQRGINPSKIVFALVGETASVFKNDYFRGSITRLQKIGCKIAFVDPWKFHNYDEILASWKPNFLVYSNLPSVPTIGMQAKYLFFLSCLNLIAKKHKCQQILIDNSLDPNFFKSVDNFIAVK